MYLNYISKCGKGKPVPFLKNQNHNNLINMFLFRLLKYKAFFSMSFWYNLLCKIQIRNMSMIKPWFHLFPGSYILYKAYLKQKNTLITEVQYKRKWNLMIAKYFPFRHLKQITPVWQLQSLKHRFQLRRAQCDL